MMGHKEKPHQTSPAVIIQNGGIFIKMDDAIKPANETPYKKDPKDENPARLPHSQAQTPKTIEMKT